MTDRLELRGRLSLWYSAVLQSQILLKLAARSKSGAELSDLKTEVDTYNKAPGEFCRSRPDHVEGQPKESDREAFNKIYPKPYPTWHERNDTHDACVELAIVYFCQILSIGYEDAGSAAKNDDPFRDQHLTSIATDVFRTLADLDRFNSLCDELLVARNTMVGHADATAFHIQHGDPVSKMNMYRQAWQNIDLKYWRSILGPFRVGIGNYILSVTADDQA